MLKSAIVSGSFDPITKGHLWLIDQACKLYDKVHVVVGDNPSKKYMFETSERINLIEQSLKESKLDLSKLEVSYLGNELLVHRAQFLGATHMVRGIRSLIDFSYESGLTEINRKIAPEITTIYLSPPPELSTVSSSTLKSFVGYSQWESLVKDYACDCVIEALREKSSKF